MAVAKLQAAGLLPRLQFVLVLATLLPLAMLCVLLVLLVSQLGALEGHGRCGRHVTHTAGESAAAAGGC